MLVLGAAACGSSGGDDFGPPGSMIVDGGVDGRPQGDGGSVDAAVDNHGSDLSITIADSPDPVGASATLTYTIDVLNGGGLDATDVKVIHRLPAGNITFLAATGIGWSCTAVGQIVTCTRASLLVGQAPSIFVQVTTPPVGGMITTSATVEATTPDNTMANNTATATTMVLTPADLSIAIADSPDPVAASGMVTYQITVANAGPGSASMLSMTDTLAAGVAFISASGPGWSCAASGQTVTCTIPILAASASSAITMSVSAPASGGTLMNTATISAVTPDPIAANNTASTTTTVNAAADLSVTLSASPDPVVASGTLTYLIDVDNAGPNAASGITVTDQLPGGNVTFLDATGSGWTCAASGQVVTCTRGSLLVGAAPTITLHIRAPSAATILTDTATVTSTSSDLNPTNNMATTTTTVSSAADLSIAVTDSPDPVGTGADLTYTLSVANAGPSVAQALTVSDVLPAGASFISAIGTNWTCAAAGQQVTCTTPTLPIGTAPPLVISVTAPGVDSTITNTASVSTTTLDPVSNNNTASATTTVNAPSDLALALSASPSPVAAQSTLTYTLDVANLGPRDATNLVVTNRLPDGNVSFQSATGIGWTCSQAGQIITCTRALLLVGAAPSILIKITTPASFTSLVDTASVTASTADADLANNSAMVTTNGATPLADLSVTISDAPDPVTPSSLPGCANNDCVSYTIQVANAGPQSATGISVVLTIPVSGTFFSVIGSGWVCPAPTGGTITCTRGSSLPSGASAPDITLTWKAPFPGGFSIVLGATVNSTSTDPDTTNNMATNDTTVTP